MSFRPASNGSTAAPSAPRMQPAQLPGSFSYDAPQSIPPDTQFDNPRHPDMFNNADSFSLAAFNTLQGPRQGGNPSPHPLLLNDQAPSDVVWPRTNPTFLPDGPSQYIFSNQSFQTACPCPTCVAHRTTAGPVQFGGGQPAPPPAGQNAMTPSAPASSSPTSRRIPTAPPTWPPAQDASMQYPGAVDAGLTRLAQPTADTGYSRTSTNRRRVRPLRNPRRGREVPFVRVKDRVEWVRRDLMKMTLWFNWSPDAEVEAYELWDEPPPHLVSPAMGPRRQVPSSPRMPFLPDADPLSL